jgi:hypothetical protein
MVSVYVRSYIYTSRYGEYTVFYSLPWPHRGVVHGSKESSHYLQTKVLGRRLSFFFVGMAFRMRLKRGQPVPSLVNVLESHITQTYGKDPEAYSSDIKDFEKMRNELLALDIHESNLSLLINYHDVLSGSISPKFTINESSQIQLQFEWMDVFSRGKTCLSISSFDLAFEKACILFNIGSILACLAYEENKDSSEGLKKACNLLQNSVSYVSCPSFSSIYKNTGRML